MIGKPIHCDIPTATMSRLSYARILVEVDLLQELPNAIQVVLPNGTPLSQQVTYESLPRFCKRCWVIGHSANACNRGPSPMQKKRPHTAAVTKDADVVGKQQSDNADPPAPTATVDAVDLMKGHPERKRSKIVVSGTKHSSNLDPRCTAEEETTPDVVTTPAPKATADAIDLMKGHSSERKRSKLAASGTKQSSNLATRCTAEEEAAPTVVTRRRQYLTRSRAAVTSDGTPIKKQKLKGPAIVLMSMSSSGTTPS
jgi:hypothetical protein